MTLAVFVAPVVPGVVIGGFFYPKQGAVLVLLLIIAWRMLASAGEQAGATGIPYERDL